MIQLADPSITVEIIQPEPFLQFSAAECKAFPLEKRAPIIFNALLVGRDSNLRDSYNCHFIEDAMAVIIRDTPIGVRLEPMLHEFDVIMILQQIQMKVFSIEEIKNLLIENILKQD